MHGQVGWRWCSSRDRNEITGLMFRRDQPAFLVYFTGSRSALCPSRPRRFRPQQSALVTSGIPDAE